MKKFISINLVAGLFLLSAGQTLAIESDAPFKDVPVGSEYYDAVSYMKEEGIVSGYEDGTFKPLQTVNRAEFTKIVVGSKGYMLPATHVDTTTAGLDFTDIENNAWYNPWLRQALEWELIGGYPDGTFKPAQEINFAEASKIIVVSYGGEFAGAGYEPADWFHKYVNVLQDRNAIPNTILSFDQKITRGEMAEILYRLKKEINDKPSLNYEDLAAAKGKINGSLSYPSEGLPPDLKACAENTTSNKVYCTYKREKNENYLYGFGYNLNVPAGTYHVYLSSGQPEGNIRGLYSEFVTCGMDSNNCKSHNLIDVVVKAGQTNVGVDPGDWYAA